MALPATLSTIYLLSLACPVVSWSQWFETMKGGWFRFGSGGMMSVVAEEDGEDASSSLLLHLTVTAMILSVPLFPHPLAMMSLTIVVKLLRIALQLFRRALR